VVHEAPSVTACMYMELMTLNKLTYIIFYINIPNNSCHTLEHKLAAVRYLTNHLSTYPMHNTEKEKENYTMKQILQNNIYDTAILNKVS
jgi:hypothetical protein